MAGQKQLICWEEAGTKKWDMIMDSAGKNFQRNLLKNPKVDPHTIFIIPCNRFVAGIWLNNDTHKHNRVDFGNFYEDYGTHYEPPTVEKENKEILSKTNEDKTKYGRISPDGRYFSTPGGTTMVLRRNSLLWRD